MAINIGAKEVSMLPANDSIEDNRRVRCDNSLQSL